MDFASEVIFLAHGLRRIRIAGRTRHGDDAFHAKLGAGAEHVERHERVIGDEVEWIKAAAASLASDHVDRFRRRAVERRCPAAAHGEIGVCVFRRPRFREVEISVNRSSDFVSGERERARQWLADEA